MPDIDANEVLRQLALHDSKSAIVVMSGKAADIVSTGYRITAEFIPGGVRFLS